MTSRDGLSLLESTRLPVSTCPCLLSAAFSAAPRPASFSRPEQPCIAKSSRGSMKQASLYLDEWIIARRGPRHVDSLDRPYAYLVEPEAAPGGGVVDVATVFLTN